MWQELARILALLINNYQKLQELNKEKHGVLILVKMQELEKLIAREDIIIKEINQAEKQRRQLLQKMADSGVKVRPDMEMHQVWEQCPNAQQKELLYKLHKMLAQLVKDVQEANANNEILITSALEAINAKLNQPMAVGARSRLFIARILIWRHKVQEFIQFLRQQLVLCLRLLELSGQQREALIHTAAPAVRRLTKEIETVIIDLNLLEKKRKAFLQQQKAQNAAEWLSTQRDSLEKNMALQLVGKLEKALNQLKIVAGDNKQYLDKNMSYIDYNINVLTGTAAGVTYSAAEAGGVGTLTGTKMFEANI